MKYLSQCTDEQIKELMRCYAKNYEDISISRDDYSIDITLIVDGIPETYECEDYSVVVYDWDDSNCDCLVSYRKKLLEWFGNQYAIDFLLNDY